MPVLHAIGKSSLYILDVFFSSSPDLQYIVCNSVTVENNFLTVSIYVLKSKETQNIVLVSSVIYVCVKYSKHQYWE